MNIIIFVGIIMIIIINTGLYSFVINIFINIVINSIIFFISSWQTESYSFRVSENGATFTEDVEVDVDNQTEVFRVPQHNDLDAMEMMNDFREVRC